MPPVVVADLAKVARRSDEAVRKARAELVQALREAARQGLTQAQIAQLIGRSQPEVSRLLRFHGRGPLALRLRRHAREVRDLIDQAGGSNVRVFGSVATGAEHAGSDIDLLFDMSTPMGLMELGALERRLSELLGADVDLIPAAVLRPDLRDRVLAEAVTL
jgi:predicted nucleotidyltransferase